MSFDPNVSSWTSAQLLSDVRRKARIPAGSLDWTDDVLLRDASEVIWSLAGWAQKLAGDGRLTFSFDRSSVAAISGPYRAANEFLLPVHAIGDTVTNVAWIAHEGGEKPLQQIELSEQSRFDSTSTPPGEPVYYAFIAGRVRVYPAPVQGTGAIRFNYQRRHGELIADSVLMVATALSATDAGTGYTQIALTASSPFAVGDYVDLMQDEYPYRVIYPDLYVGASLGSTVSIYLPPAYVPASGDLNGMRLVRCGQTPYVSLPLEFRTCVTEQVASKVLRDIGDMTQAQAFGLSAQTELTRILGILTPRGKDRKKVINVNSPFRSRMSRRRGCW